jgi:hypothetical protein
MLLQNAQSNSLYTSSRRSCFPLKLNFKVRFFYLFSGQQIETYYARTIEMKRSILTGEKKVVSRSGVPLLSAMPANPSNDEEQAEELTPAYEGSEIVDTMPMIVSVVIIFASSLAWFALRRRGDEAPQHTVPQKIKAMEPDTTKASLSARREAVSQAESEGNSPSMDAGDADIRQYEQHLQAMISARRVAAAASTAAAMNGSVPDPRFGAIPAAAADPLHGLDPRLGVLPSAPPPPSTPPPPQTPPLPPVPAESCHYI